MNSVCSKLLRLRIGICLWSLLAAGAADAQAPLKNALPESVGFSSERLSRLDSVMQSLVERHEYAGVVIEVARHGSIIHQTLVGSTDLSGSHPVRQDTIFRLFSMTKPVTAVAMMILYDEGQWSPQDPISKYVSEFANLRVYDGVAADGSVKVKSPDHPPTMGELMSHTAGFGYGLDSNPVDRLYTENGAQPLYRDESLQDLVKRVGRLPLYFQPGSTWKYSVAADIQGYIVEKLTGMSVAEFMKNRIFAPLKMTNTGFSISPDQWGRVAELYKKTDAGELVSAIKDAEQGYGYSLKPGPPPVLLGGAGLFSTARDFVQFAQMLANDGELDGVRILSPASVHLLRSNHIPQVAQEVRGGGYEFVKPRPGVGYAYDGGVVTDPGLAQMPVGKGTYYWEGAAGTWFWVDPENDVVVVGMVQRWGWGVEHSVPGLAPIPEDLARALVYQALLHPEK